MNRSIPVLAEDIPIIKKSDIKRGSFRNKQIGSGPYRVTNASFRDFRLKYAQGGDFIIFSDVFREKLVSPVVLEFKL